MSVKKNRIIGIAVVAAAVLIVICVVVNLFGGSCKSVIKEYLNASFEADGKAMLSLMPDKVVDALCEEEDMTRKECIKKITESLEDQIDYLDRYFDEWTFSYEIINEEDITGKELKSLKKDYEINCDVIVRKAKTVEVEITFRDADNDISNSMEIGLIKVGGSWYLDVASMGAF